MGLADQRHDRRSGLVLIPAREILDLRAEWLLRGDVIERDYTLGWMLAAIAANAELADTWVFKGGTCLRKCYYETYRFSEDLDFTVIDGGPEDPADLQRIFGDVAAWLYDRAGIQLEVDDRSFSRRQNRRGPPNDGRPYRLSWSDDDADPAEGQGRGPSRCPA